MERQALKILLQSDHRKRLKFRRNCNDQIMAKFTEKLDFRGKLIPKNMDLPRRRTLDE